MNERFLFMPSIGFSVLLAYWFIRKIPAFLKKKGYHNLVNKIPAGLIIILLLCYTLKSLHRIPDWKNGDTLNEAAAHISVNSARANSYYAYSLYQQGIQARQANDIETELLLYDKALPYVDRAIEIHPTYKDALRTKGGIMAGIYQRDNDLGKLLTVFEELLSRNHAGFFDQYMVYLNNKGTNINELNAFYHKTGYDVFYKMKNDLNHAKQYLEYGFTLNPNDIRILTDLAEVYYKLNDFNRVQNICIRGLQLEPGNEIFSQYYQLVQGK
jgi:tetratricopeptide (TPR) repeat protein